MPHKDPEARKAYMQEWVKKNRERLREYQSWHRHTPIQKEKRQEYWRKRNYGINNAEWNWLYAQQSGLCAVCRKVPPKYVDHNHENGKLRGLLCPSCNAGIGLLGDSVSALCRAAAYIERTANGIEVPKFEDIPKLAWGAGVVGAGAKTINQTEITEADLWNKSPAGGECQLSEQGECNGS